MPVYKNEKRNTWYASFYYKNWTGKRIRKKKEGFATRKQAVDYEREFIEISEGQCTMRFSSLIKIYMDDSKNRIKLSTYVTRKSIIFKHILPFFRNMAINRITPTDINHWQNWILAKNTKKSAQYLHKLNSQLSTIFHFAERFYKLKKNPVKLCSMIGSTKRKKLSFWTVRKFKRFIKAIDGQEPFCTIFNVLFWSGIRRGELLALRPSDFDFEKNRLYVSRNIVFINSKAYLSSLKTDRSERQINIPGFLAEMVKKYIQTRNIKDDEFLFYYLPSYLMDKIRLYSVKAGLQPIKIHDFRHSHASLLIEQGFSPLLVAQRLGHKDVTTTLKFYAHLYPNKQKKVAKKLDVLYKNNIE